MGKRLHGTRTPHDPVFLSRRGHVLSWSHNPISKPRHMLAIAELILETSTPPHLQNLGFLATVDHGALLQLPLEQISDGTDPDHHQAKHGIVLNKPKD